MNTERIAALADKHLKAFVNTLRGRSIESFEIFQILPYMLVEQYLRTKSESTQAGAEPLPQDQQVLVSTRPKALSKLNAEGEYIFFRLSAENEVKQLLSLCQEPESFGYLFDYCVEYVLNNSSGRMWAEFFSPKELDSLVARLLPIPAGASVWNIYAGTARIASELDQSVRFLGSERNEILMKVGQLRLLAHRCANAHISLSDPTEMLAIKMEYFDPARNFDFLLCAVPLVEFEPGASTGDGVVWQVLHALVQQGQGKAVLAIAQSFLFRESDTRTQLVDSGILDTIIELPGAIFTPATGVNISLLVLDAEKARGEWVRMIDATSMRRISQFHRRSLDTEAILAAVASTDKAGVSRAVSYEEIRDNALNLEPHRYVRTTSTSPYDVELAELLQPFRVRRHQPSSDVVPIVSPRLLKADNLDFSIQATDIAPADASRPNLVGPLQQPALLVTFQGPRLMPTVFNPKAGPVWLRHSVQVWQIKPDRERELDQAYLVSELNSDYVTEQLQARQTGSVVMQLRRDDFLRLRIRLLPLAEQRSRVESIREARVAAKREELRLLEQGIHEQSRQTKQQSFEQLADLKHALSRPLLNLASGVKLLNSALQNAGHSNLSIGNPALGGTAGLTLTSMITDLTMIDAILSRSEAQLRPEENTRDWLNIRDYLNELVARTRPLEQYFDLIYYNSFGESTTPLVFANKHLLDLLFDNIFANAARHGFDHTPLTQNPWQSVMLSAVILADEFIQHPLHESGHLMQTVVEICVANNGTPLPEGVNLETLTRKNSSKGPAANTGIGGFEVKQIISYFGGQLDLANDPSDEWPVKYIIRLPVETQEFFEEVADQDGDEAAEQVRHAFRQYQMPTTLNPESDPSAPL